MTEPRTRLRGRARHLAPALTISLLLAGTAASAGPAAASAAVPTAACAALSGPSAWGGPPPPSPGTEDNGFNGVTVLSPCDAWAVGFDQNTGGLDQTLAEHWDGTAWTVVPSPDVAGLNNQLYAVRADSATDIWTVGESFATGTDQPLILHWDGHTWAQVASPNPGGKAYLEAVRAVSPTDAWAVGSFGNTTFQSLILHWNGHKWAQVASPHPGTNAALLGVAATSASNAWAVGTFFNGTALQGFILHWNGQKWARQASPNPGGAARDTRLNAIAAGAASGKAWAVGSYFDGTTDRTLILAWTGSKWVQQASPTPWGQLPPGRGHHRRGQYLDGGCLRGRQHAVHLDPALERDEMGSGGQPHPKLFQHAVCRGRVLRHQRLGRRPVQRRQQRPRPELRHPLLRLKGLPWAAGFMKERSHWTRVPSPTPGVNAELFAVAASSASNIWAVGIFSNGTDNALAVHCC